MEEIAEIGPGYDSRIAGYQAKGWKFTFHSKRIVGGYEALHEASDTLRRGDNLSELMGNVWRADSQLAQKQAEKQVWFVLDYRTHKHVEVSSKEEAEKIIDFLNKMFSDEAKHFAALSDDGSQLFGWEVHKGVDDLCKGLPIKLSIVPIPFWKR